MIDYTKQELEGSSSTNNIYQIITNKVEPAKKKFGHFHYKNFIRKSKKQKFSVTRP